MEPKLRRKICGLIVGVIVKDGELADAEYSFLKRVLAHFGLSEEDDAWIRPIADGKQAAREFQALPPEARADALSLLLQAAAADGKIVEAERAHLAAIAEVVGMGAAELEQRLAEELAKA